MARSPTSSPRPWPALALSILAPALAGQDSGTLFENVVEVLERRYYDEEFRRDELPTLAARYRASAHAAGSRDEERAVIHAMLGEIPISHLALYSKPSYDALLGDLRGRRAATFGLELVQERGRFWVRGLLEAGPGENAGLLRGDRVLRIDGDPPGDSPRLDWRTDDAFLPDAPVHRLLCQSGDEVELVVERRPGEEHTIRVAAARYSALDAAAASARIFELGGRSYGYVHFWFIHHTGVAKLLRSKMGDEFADCDGLVVDLRGRGGSAAEVFRLLAAMRSWKRPMVALVDADSRSAKEVVAYEFQKQELGTLVGERTARAVIPATFADVGPESVLMFPSFTLDKYTRWIEGVGVTPDVSASAPVPYSAGRDPILEQGLATLHGEVMAAGNGR